SNGRSGPWHGALCRAGAIPEVATYWSLSKSRRERRDARVQAVPENASIRPACERHQDAPARWPRRFFLKLKPSRRRKLQRVSQDTVTPHAPSSLKSVAQPVIEYLISWRELILLICVSELWRQFCAACRAGQWRCVSMSSSRGWGNGPSASV